MNVAHEQLAHRYAAAFLNLFDAYITRADAEHMYTARKALEANHVLIFILSVRGIPQEKKDALVDALCKEYGLPEVLKKLTDLLFKQGRIELLAIVLRHIWWLYLKRHDMMHVYVESSCELSEAQKESVERFMAYKLPSITGIYTYTVQKKLLAGIRMHSATILWDSSLRGKLTALRHFLPS